jgi:hypothetical protein
MTKLSSGLFWWGLVTVLVMAMSFGPSVAHLLEAPPRLIVWPPELWREATVFNGQFRLFAVVGAPLDIGSILLGAIFALLLRGDRPAFWFALAAAILYLASLVTWFSVVAPVNEQLATWTPGPIPENFEALRDRWETGHIAITIIKFCGLVCVIIAALGMHRPQSA